MREQLHQRTPPVAVFYGTVSDPESAESLATLGNYDYPFFIGNFNPVRVE